MFCLMDTVYLLPALPCPGMTWKPRWPLLPLLSVKPGAANPNGFLICGLYTINEPSPPSHTETMDQHFPVCMSVCVCSFTSFVFTNLSPLPALVKPQCPLACLHHSLSFSLACLVCSSPASSFLYPILVLSVCGMGDSWSKQRWTRRTAFSLILCISFAHWCLLFSSLMFPLLGLAHFRAMACLDTQQKELRAIWSQWEKLGQKPNPSMTKG